MHSTFSALLMSSFLLINISCTLESRSTATLNISLPKLAKSSGRAVETFSAPPSSVSGFDCLAVNVMGPGIAPRGPSPNQATVDEIIGGNFCSYAGVLSPPVLAGTGGTVSLRVPKGNRRIIQILGVLSTSACEQGLFSHFDKGPNTVLDPDYPGIYEVGRVVVDLNSDSTTSVTSSYDPVDLKEVRCYRGSINCNDPAMQNGTFASGTGTAVDPYRICTVSQLQNIDTNLSDHFALETNLDLSQTSLSPIALGTIFAGSLDGQGYTIAGFSYSSNPSSPVGLIAKASGTIRRLNAVSTINSSSTTAVGGLVGELNGGTVSDCRVSGSVTGQVYVGGLIGYVANSANVLDSGFVGGGTVSGNGFVGGLVGYSAGTSILRSSADASVIGTGGGSIGGFVGANPNSLISDCRAKGNVTATTDNDVGGFAGGTGAQSSSIIRRSSAKGNVQGGSNVGGFAGRISSPGTILDSYSTGSVTSGGSPLGGFVAFLSSATVVTRAFSSTASVTGPAASSLSGFAGYAGGASITDCFSNSAVTTAGTGNAGTQLTTAQLHTASSYTNFDFGGVWDIAAGAPPFLR